LIQQVLPLPTGDALHEFEEDSDSEENMEVNESDEVVVLCKIDNAVSYLEMCVFDTTTYNLYTHHDLCVGEMSCSMCWIDVDPTDGKEGSFVAIGHMDGEISLWDLRIVNVPGPSTRNLSSSKLTKNTCKSMFIIRKNDRKLLFLAIPKG